MPSTLSSATRCAAFSRNENHNNNNNNDDDNGGDDERSSRITPLRR